jgi:hypothetical protein
LLVATLALLAAASSRPARAAGSDVATAQVLFDEGRRRMAEHDYANACPKLAESQRLSPAVGTEFNLADCWEHVGKLASSWAAFLDVADLTHRRGETEREQAARQRAAALEPRLGRLIIDVPAARRVANLEVSRDGDLVRDALWGIAVPVDAGEHSVEARAPGGLRWSGVVRTQDGQTATIGVSALSASGTAAVPSQPEGHVSVPPALPPSTVPPAPPPSPEPTHGADHTAAFVALGASVVFAGVGVLGLVEHQANINDYNTDPSCPAIGAASRPAHCSDFVSSANTWNTVAVVSLVASGVALAGGVTLWFIAPRPASSASGTTAVRCFAGVASLGCAGAF